MRSLGTGTYLETRYPAVNLGAIISQGEALLIDAPLRTEDARDWTIVVAERGQPRYLALLDSHPDRALGARGFELPILAHGLTGEAMAGWPDTFKGGARPIGAESDRLKRITGVAKGVPSVTFSEAMTVYVGKVEVHAIHRPGPFPGAMWVAHPQAKVLFLGDGVMMNEPPFLGECVIDSWLASLAELSDKRWAGYTLVSSRDGVVDRRRVNSMVRLLAKTQERLDRIGGRGAAAEGCRQLASQLLRSYKLPASKRDLARERLEVGLQRLHARLYLSEA